MQSLKLYFLIYLLVNKHPLILSFQFNFTIPDNISNYKKQESINYEHTAFTAAAFVVFIRHAAYYEKSLGRNREVFFKDNKPCLLLTIFFIFP